MNRKIIKEVIYPVKGTTILELYDDGFNQKGTNYEFHGNISAAPLGMLRIRQVETQTPDFDYDEITVDIVQAKNKENLDTYLNGEYYPSQLKQEYELNCETASFVIRTKFADDMFDTGGDGLYGYLYQMKQYFGMILNLSFDAGLFSFEEIESRFLALFPKRRG